MTLLFKLSQTFYRFAVSQVFDLLDTGRTADTIAKKVSSFLSSHSEINKERFQIQIAEMAEKKFNQFVIPYLKISPVNLLDSGFRNTIEFNTSNQDNLQFFLHDLLHEILTPGSTEKFKEFDKDFLQRQKETWEKTHDEDDDYEPSFELSHRVYNLADFFEEQVAESLTNKTKITNNGLERYIKDLFISVMNSYFDVEYSRDSMELHPVFEWDEVESFLLELKNQFEIDLNEINDSKYATIARKFLKSAFNWIDQLKPEMKAKLDKSGQLYLNNILSILKSKTIDWTGSNFNLKQEKIQFDKSKPFEFEHSEFGEKPIQNLTDDFRMTLARRWLLAVDKEVDKMIYSVL